MKEKFSKNMFVAFLCVFGIVFGISKIWHLMRNSLCFAYLGCNMGFFGYDALVHFTSGLAIGSGMVWLFRRSSKGKAGSAFFTSQDQFWKTLLFILGVAAFIGVFWETLEYIYDYVRIVFLHMNILHPNQASQASNSDTMGDLVFGLFGALVAAISIW